MIKDSKKNMIQALLKAFKEVPIYRLWPLTSLKVVTIQKPSNLTISEAQNLNLKSYYNSFHSCMHLCAWLHKNNILCVESGCVVA